MHDRNRPQNHRDINEDARDRVRALTDTEAFRQSCRERKKVEMRFAHMKRILKLDRLRLRGLNGVRDEVLPTATAQNLRRRRLWQRLAEQNKQQRADAATEAH